MQIPLSIDTKRYNEVVKSGETILYLLQSYSLEEMELMHFMIEMLKSKGFIYELIVDEDTKTKQVRQYYLYTNAISAPAISLGGRADA